MNNDLTAIFLTSNKVPDGWADYQFKTLKEALGDYPMIIISRKPMDVGYQNVLDTEKPSSINFYRQLLRGAKLATTDYVACVEDDTLYNKEHFACFRPGLNVFGYNMNRWSVATWGEPVYSRRESKVGAGGIYPRLELIEAMEEKLATVPKDAETNWFQWKVGEPGTGGEKELGIKIRQSKGFYSKIPIIQFNHDYFTNAESTPEVIARRRKKNFGIVKANRIPFWGEAEELISNFK
jgi:hypothetical protein